ncbi:MAG: hydrogenase formation protein HypD [Planctomycetota bacterium]
MQRLKDFQDPKLIRALIQHIEALSHSRSSYVLMEVCGTHTQAIGRWGLRELLPPQVRLVSGPGCPVCVTPGEYIDNACRLALEREAVIVSFGDLLRVPGETSSLEEAKGEGADVRLAYSPFQALSIARSVEREVVFLAVGFETTACGIASAVRAAREEGVENLSFYLAAKRIPPALDALLQDPEIRLDGLVLPGHVSTVIGTRPYGVLLKHGVPGAVAGFEPAEILKAVESLLAAANDGRVSIENLYPHAVREEGNPTALAAMDAVFVPADAVWRGIGSIPDSGFRLREEYAALDAERRFNLGPVSSRMKPGCLCGEVLKGKLAPDHCPLFGRACTPAAPQGPCMVSSEGSCSAWYKYHPAGV